jgi:hypothetical protein
VRLACWVILAARGFNSCGVFENEIQVFMPPRRRGLSVNHVACCLEKSNSDFFVLVFVYCLLFFFLFFVFLFFCFFSPVNFGDIYSGRCRIVVHVDVVFNM